MKNSIWYRFSSEKDSYEITFDTIDISVRDIKQKIIRRRNMVKYPDEFDLIFYEEENPTIEKEDKDLIKPMKHLIVKRLPRYIRRSNFIKIVKEPKDFMLNKNNENNFRREELQQVKRYTEPLEKISKYLRKEMIYKQFKCKICEKLDEETYNNFIISLCCKETFCLNCYNQGEKCPFCKGEKKGYVLNKAESNLVKKLMDILAKKEEQEKMQQSEALKQVSNKNNNSTVGIDVNQKNNENNNQNNNNSLLNNQTNKKSQKPVQDSITSYQLQKQLIEGSQFFIIKSSNLENIEKSKNKSIWATTKTNSLRLNQAFNNGKVILIFSVGNTQMFKGYAIMTSTGSDIPSNVWSLDNNSNIRLSGDFSVSWLCYCDLTFNKTKHLNVNKSRDCTELEQNIGNKLCELCYEQEKEELAANPQRIRIEVNEQYINKINEDINNNRNKQKQKLNNNNNIINKPSQINNEMNKSEISNINNSSISISNVQNNQPPAPNPQPMYNPFQPMIYFSPFYMQNQFQQMQQKRPDMMIPNMINQPQMQQKQENDKKENKEQKKKSRHNKKKSRSRDRSRSRSRSRNKNKSRSSRSRRSDSSDSRSEGRSKYSRSRK